MEIGVPKEIKVHEYRVGLVPANVRELVTAGHEVWIESGAGDGIGITDMDYEAAGARIAPTAKALFARAQLIVKVKEPQLPECAMLGRGQVLFAFLHLAADRALAEALCKCGVSAIAYETVTADDGSLPLLTPMSEIAGRMSVQVGATCLHKIKGGSGILLGGAAGVEPAKVVILGGGAAGCSAAEIAVGLQADVSVVDVSVARLRQLAQRFANTIETVYSTAHSIESLALSADLIIGAVLIPGAAAPKLLTRAMLRRMKAGCVLVDIAIDQGGCFESSRPTTHADPTYIVDGIVHYCVTNMPGAVARTSTFALNNVTLPFVKALAGKGYDRAIREDRHLACGVNVHQGRIVHEAVARDLMAA